MIRIEPYNDKRDAKALFVLMQQEADWGDYSGSDMSIAKYKVALKQSATFVLYDDEICCGFIRAKDDFGFCTFIHDLLVGKNHRGNGYGKKLIEYIADAFDGTTTYVMSDNDIYYNKQGYATIEGRLIKIRE